MKRIQVLILCVVVLCSCASCGSVGNISSEEKNSTAFTEISNELNETEASSAAETGTAQSMTQGELQTEDATTESQEETDMKLQVQVGENTFMATMENNTAVEALIAMMEEAPVVIEMSDYSGFEKVGSLGTSLPTSNKQTTTSAGDIVLYNGNQIVIFYGSNSWSYTRIGQIDDLTGWEDALGSGDVTVTFSIAD
ncbi:MAG: cyclophilin-like fold protein [Lachnospiraceae bacterium]|nr:cyclophilin-like fold protein [Lachnospiraceae bacterium]